MGHHTTHIQIIINLSELQCNLELKQMSLDSNLNVREVACGSRRKSGPSRPQRESNGVAHGCGVREAQRDEVAAGSWYGS